MTRKLAFCLVFLAALASAADAATFEMRGKTIQMRGQIAAADPLRLSRLIEQGARSIVLESPGGLVAAGSYMADLIRTAGLKTIVRADCASACTMMFYAGTSRVLTGRLGFHKATDAVGTTNYAAQMKRYGAPREAVRAVTMTPAGEMTWLDADLDR